MHWVNAVERAYVAAATGAPPSMSAAEDTRAGAAVGAIASRYLAVGSPRTLGVILAHAGDGELGRLAIEAHGTWFTPRELRCAVVGGAPCTALGTPVTIAEALASDIVVVLAPIAIRAGDLRRGTHVNAIAAVTLDAELAKLATIVHEVPGLGALAAGLVDGRQLDELTIFIAGDLAIARAALVES